jgi:hypothetical protein
MAFVYKRPIHILKSSKFEGIRLVMIIERVKVPKAERKVERSYNFVPEIVYRKYLEHGLLTVFKKTSNDMSAKQYN